MTGTPTLRRLAASAIIVATFAFGACGGDDDADTGTDQATGTDAADSGESGDTVEIVDFNYKPADLKVKAGTKVTFTNVDTFVHTVTAKDKSYDSGNMEEGATFEHTFAEAGTYEYFCAVHESMKAKVTAS